MRNDSPNQSAEPHGEVARHLGRVVEEEARRRFTETQLAPDPTRVAAGWERRFIADAARAREAVELYEQLGYEVCADPVKVEQVDDGCSECWLLTNLGFVTIYTRKRNEPSEARKSD